VVVSLVEALSLPGSDALQAGVTDTGRLFFACQIAESVVTSRTWTVNIRTSSTLLRGLRVALLAVHLKFFTNNQIDQLLTNDETGQTTGYS